MRWKPGEPGPALTDPERVLWEYYRYNVGLGLRGVARGGLRWGLRRLWNPVDYWRCAEIPHALIALQPRPGDRVLDVGSPKFAASFLATVHGCQVHATDISDYFVARLIFFSRVDRLAILAKRRLRLLIEDGRQLSYRDGSFDKAYSISVLEHIPGDGDTATVRECARVLKPGGRLVITTNISKVHRDVMLVPRRHPEHFMPEMVSDPDAPHFFERRYDRQTLTERLIRPSGLRLVQEVVFVERYRYYERLFSRLPFRLRILLFPAGIVLAKALIRREPSAERAFQRSFAVAMLALEKADEPSDAEPGRVAGTAAGGEPRNPPAEGCGRGSEALHSDGMYRSVILTPWRRSPARRGSRAPGGTPDEA